jgi:outer membrane biosynthesis protein TonB
MQEVRPEKVKVLSIALALAALGVFVGIVWYAYDQGRQVGNDAAAPLIKAPSKPVKIKPRDAGGMRVPDQDKLVLQDVNGAKVERVERLLPQPETPVLPAQTASTTDTAVATAPKPPPVVPQVQAEAPRRPEPPKIVKPVTDPPPASAAVTAPATPAVKEATPAAKPAPAKTAAATPATGNFRVQIAAVRSQQRAEAEWQRVQRKNPNVLSGLTLMTQQINLGADKGIFFRIQAGPLSRQQAAKICQVLKSRKQACILVRP